MSIEFGVTFSSCYFLHLKHHKHTHTPLQNHQGTKEREIRHRDVLAQMQTNLLGSAHNFKHRTKL